MFFLPKLFNCWSTVWLDFFLLHICFMLNMEQLTELKKNTRHCSTTITTVCTATGKFPETTSRFTETKHVQKQIVKQQDILQKILLKQGKREKGSNTFSAEGIANSSEFIYKPEEGITFPAYFKRYETIFAKRCQSWSDEEKNYVSVTKVRCS